MKKILFLAALACAFCGFSASPPRAFTVYSTSKVVCPSTLTYKKDSAVFAVDSTEKYIRTDSGYYYAFDGCGSIAPSNTAGVATVDGKDYLRLSGVRKTVVITHVSGEPVWLGFDNTAVSGSGVRLPETGQITIKDFSGEIYVVTTSGTAEISIQEF